MVQKPAFGLMDLVLLLLVVVVAAGAVPVISSASRTVPAAVAPWKCRRPHPD